MEHQEPDREDTLTRRNGLLCWVRRSRLLADAHEEGYNSRERFVLGMCSLQCLRRARPWDMRSKMVGTGVLVGRVLENVWDRPLLGIGPSFVGQGV